MKSRLFKTVVIVYLAVLTVFVSCKKKDEVTAKTVNTGTVSPKDECKEEVKTAYKQSLLGMKEQYNIIVAQVKEKKSEEICGQRSIHEAQINNCQKFIQSNPNTSCEVKKEKIKFTTDDVKKVCDDYQAILEKIKCTGKVEDKNNTPQVGKTSTAKNEISESKGALCLRIQSDLIQAQKESKNLKENTLKKEIKLTERSKLSSIYFVERAHSGLSLLTTNENDKSLIEQNKKFLITALTSEKSEEITKGPATDLIAAIKEDCSNSMKLFESLKLENNKLMSADKSQVIENVAPTSNEFLNFDYVESTDQMAAVVSHSEERGILIVNYFKGEVYVDGSNTRFYPLKVAQMNTKEYRVYRIPGDYLYFEEKSLDAKKSFIIKGLF